MRYLSIDLHRLRNSDTWAEAHKHPWMALACQNLWYAAAERDGEGLPDDDDHLARLAGVKLAIFKKLRAKVLSAWQLVDGRWVHPVIQAEGRRYQSTVNGGKRGAAARWKINDLDTPPIGPPTGGGNGQANGHANAPPNASSLSHSPVPSSKTQIPASARELLLDRLAREMKLDLSGLHRRPNFIQFPSVFHRWQEAGCDAEQDIWPEIRRLAGRGKAINSPQFFEAAVMAAKEKRLAEPQKTVTPEQMADRRRVYAEHGLWPAEWGDRPVDIIGERRTA